MPEPLFKEIERYRQESHQKSIEEAVDSLIRQGLNLPDYFRRFDWLAAETEADQEIAAGQVESFDSVDAFVEDLRQ